MPAAKPPKTYFKKIQSFEADYAPAKFTQYESERTGMRVVVCDRKGPKVQGYFALATEIHDDSGAPHTLEHLIFMGSRSYKYKGVLDKLATRAYSYTNAWTATDHTAYELHTAGWDGFAQILPVYLEHVLLPTLTDAGCYTEVHHIDSTGRDAGVVYSEMQGRQNQQGDLMELASQRALYPKNIGFRYETGGQMEALRTLTADRIRQFHKDMYQPRNLCVVLIGEVDHENLLKILDEFEGSNLDEVPPPDAPFTRPWVDSGRTPPLKETVIERVEFPEEDESQGEIQIGIFGPSCNDLLQSTAMDVLQSYLAQSSASVLENVLVEKEKLASAVVYYNQNRPNTVVSFNLTSVETGKLEAVEKRFFQILKDVASKPLDMGYMKECIQRMRRHVVYSTETNSSVFTEPLIEDHLFGDRGGHNLFEGMSNIKVFDQLGEWTDKQWRDYITKWMIDAHHVSILGVPSRQLSKKLKADEKARVKAQQERLGEAGLKELAKKLEEAKAKNDIEVPSELLENFKVPGTESIHFFPTVTARSGLAKNMGKLENEIQKVIDQDKADLPLFIHFEHIPTSFVEFSLVLNTSGIPVELKPLVSVYIMNFFTTPIERDGKRIEFEDVVMQLEKDTVSYNIDAGSELGNGELIQIKFVVEREKYETAIKWLKDVLFHSVFDVERLKATLTKMLADIPNEKRSGNYMCAAVDSMIHWSTRSSSRAQNTLVKALYLKRIKRLLQDEPESVISRMETVRTSLAHFSNMRLFVIADVTKLPSPIAAWKTFIAELDTSKALLPLDKRRDALADAARSPGTLGYIVPMPTIESAFLSLTAPGPDSFSHPQLPALMVAIAYLDATEGPLWVSVRGAGLAYGAYFIRRTDTGLLRFSIYRSPDAFKAFDVARKVVRGYADGATPFDKHALEGAVSQIVMGFADEQDSMVAAAKMGFGNLVIKGIPKDWADGMLRKVREVKEEEIRGVLKEVVMGVFEPARANLVVTCGSIMQEGLKKNFEEAGFKPDIQPLTYFQDDYGLKPKDGEDEDEPEEEGGEDKDSEEDDGSEGDD